MAVMTTSSSEQKRLRRIKELLVRLASYSDLRAACLLGLTDGETPHPNGRLAGAGLTLSASGTTPQLFDAPHIAPLTDFVRRLRAERGGAVPWFDPTEAGADARILLLFENPGRRADAAQGSGFISADNDDKSAEKHVGLLPRGRHRSPSRHRRLEHRPLVPGRRTQDRRRHRARHRGGPPRRPARRSSSFSTFFPSFGSWCFSAARLRPAGGEHTAGRCAGA
jgi:hypothetical protein